MTNREGPAELRIYTGLHAGARTRLHPGTYLLGSDSTCDIILRDKGVANRHAELRIGGDSGNRLHPLPEYADSFSDGIDIKSGNGVAIGPVVIAVEKADSPWANVPWEQTESAAIDSSTRAPLGPSLSQRDSPISAPSPADDALHTEPQNSRRSQPVRLAALLLISALGLSSIWQNEAPEPAPSLAPIAVSADSGRLAQITAILTSLEMNDRAQVISLPNGSDLVTALLLSEDEKESLAAALSRLNPRPGLKTSSENELIQSVIDAVAGKGETLRAEYLGAGNFRLHGNVREKNARDILLSELASEFPAVRQFEDALTTPEMMAEQLVAQLRTEGFSDISGTWNEDSFVITCLQAPENRLTLARALEQADQRFGRWLKFSVRTGKQKTLTGKAKSTLPFQIGSVVGGSNPYVVLLNGQKILVGGQIENWYLTGVDSEHVVFEGPRRISIPR